MLYSVCHADGMAKKQHSSTTEWHVGQALAWPVAAAESNVLLVKP
jgi:hypothetical protein